MPDDTTAQPIDPNVTPNATQPQANVQLVERLTSDDQAALDAAKAKKESALTAAKLAVSEGENAELRYNNLVLNIALKYRLSDGDSFSPDGLITRKNRV